MRYSKPVLETSTARAAERATSDDLSAFAPLKEYVLAVVMVAVVTLVSWLLTPLTGYSAISLIYLLGVLLAGMILSRGPVLLVAALSALSWNFLFIPPRFTF